LGVVEDSIGAVRDAAARAVGRPSLEKWWRVGYHSSPLDFVPRDLCSWENRFDDPKREYRTLYCATKKVTALREVLAPLRPNANVRADFARFQLEQGYAPDQLYLPAREIRAAWRREHVLVQAKLSRNGALADLDDVVLREQLEETHLELLLQYGMDHLDISEIRSKTRAITQAISRDLYDQGASGLLFRSALDDEQCVVIFEGRASLADVEEAWIDLADDVDELRLVCSEFGLILR
jgi:hypothetical protein